MKPPSRPKTDYERIESDTWIGGTIEEVMYDMERKSIWEGKEKVGPAIRFKFKLDGYKYPHYSRWMSFSYGEKANLFKKYLKNLVNDAKPDMDFDLDLLKGLPIKTMWTADGDFDNLEQIRAVKKYGDSGVTPPPESHDDAPEEVVDEESIPF